MRELVHNNVHDTGRVIQIGHITYLGHKQFSELFLRHSRTDQEVKDSIMSLTYTTAHTCMSCMHSSFICAGKTHQPGAFLPPSGRIVTRYMYQVASVLNSNWGWTTNHTHLIHLALGQHPMLGSLVLAPRISLARGDGSPIAGTST